MTMTALLCELREREVILESRGDRLRIDAPKGVMTPELMTLLMKHKSALLATLTPSWHGAVLSFSDWPGFRSENNLRVISSAWDGHGPVKVVVSQH